MHRRGEQVLRCQVLPQSHPVAGGPQTLPRFTPAHLTVLPSCLEHPHPRSIPPRGSAPRAPPAGPPQSCTPEGRELCGLTAPSPPGCRIEIGGTARIWGAEAGRSEEWGCHSARCPPPAAPAGARSGMGPARYPRPDGPGPVGTGPTKRGRIATWRLGKTAHGSVWCGSDAVPAKSQVGLCQEPSSRPEEPLSLHRPP